MDKVIRLLVNVIELSRKSSIDMFTNIMHTILTKVPDNLKACLRFD